MSPECQTAKEAPLQRGFIDHNSVLLVHRVSHEGHQHIHAAWLLHGHLTRRQRRLTNHQLMLQGGSACARQLHLHGDGGHKLLPLPDGQLQPRTLVMGGVRGLVGQVAEVAAGGVAGVVGSTGKDHVGANPVLVGAAVPVRVPDLSLQSPGLQVDARVQGQRLLEADIDAVGGAGRAEEPIRVGEELTLAHEEGLGAGLARDQSAHGLVDGVAVHGGREWDGFARALLAPDASHDAGHEGRGEFGRVEQHALAAAREEHKLGVEVDRQFNLMHLGKTYVFTGSYIHYLTISSPMDPYLN